MDYEYYDEDQYETDVSSAHSSHHDKVIDTIGIVGTSDHNSDDGDDVTLGCRTPAPSSAIPIPQIDLGAHQTKIKMTKPEEDCAMCKTPASTFYYVKTVNYKPSDSPYPMRYLTVSINWILRIALDPPVM